MLLCGKKDKGLPQHVDPAIYFHPEKTDLFKMELIFLFFYTAFSTL